MFMFRGTFVLQGGWSWMGTSVVIFDGHIYNCLIFQYPNILTAIMHSCYFTTHGHLYDRHTDKCKANLHDTTSLDGVHTLKLVSSMTHVE